MRRAAFVFAALLSAMAPPLASAEPIPFTPERWQIDGLNQRIQRDGRDAIQLGATSGPLRGGGASIKDLEFSTGVVEFDLMVSGGRDFVSFAFRGRETEAELFYIRPIQSGNPDATQYTPVVNGNLAWQIFTGDGFTSAVTFKPNQWMRVRADIYEDSAVFSIDGQPALISPDLKTDAKTGGISIGANAGAMFANVSVTPIPDYKDPRPKPADAPLPAGTVRTWKVSAPIAEADGMARAGKGDWSGVEWRDIAVEMNGIANLSKTGARAPGQQTAVARFTLNSRDARDVAMRFGFSDKVRVFLNGRPLYEGADQQSSRDYRFLGMVGLWDTVFLPLKAGKNEVAFVVTEETNGGWAAMAQIEEAAGVVIE